ncbi:MAG TPA: DUF4159 domain-containing protein [Gemmatimonadales bacterium]|nr:DUF4159 domain-containing protein [Gemmatimonadales bacterium]
MRRLALAAVLALAPGSILAQEGAGAGALTIGRLRYDGGGDWYANPSSLPNLLAAVRAQTGLPTTPREVVVGLRDEVLWSVPYLYATGHGEIRFTPAELETLRRWLRQGGFLHLDDNYGMDPSARRILAELLPGVAPREVPRDHPIYSVVNRFPAGLPKIHEHDGKPPEGLGLFLDGRLAVFYSFETDLGDGWEDPGVHDDPPAKREAALAMGVNLFAYAVGYGR